MGCVTHCSLCSNHKPLAHHTSMATLHAGMHARVAKDRNLSSFSNPLCITVLSCVMVRITKKKWDSIRDNYDRIEHTVCLNKPMRMSSSIPSPMLLRDDLPVASLSIRTPHTHTHNAHTHARMHTCTHACMHARTHARTRTRMHTSHLHN